MQCEIAVLCHFPTKHILYTSFPNICVFFLATSLKIHLFHFLKSVLFIYLYIPLANMHFVYAAFSNMHILYPFQYMFFMYNFPTDIILSQETF